MLEPDYGGRQVKFSTGQGNINNNKTRLTTQLYMYVRHFTQRSLRHSMGVPLTKSSVLMPYTDLCQCQTLSLQTFY